MLNFTLISFLLYWYILTGFLLACKWIVSLPLLLADIDLHITIGLDFRKVFKNKNLKNQCLCGNILQNKTLTTRLGLFVYVLSKPLNSLYIMKGRVESYEVIAKITKRKHFWSHLQIKRKRKSFFLDRTSKRFEHQVENTILSKAQSNLDFREAEKHVTGFKEVTFQLGALLWGTFLCTSAKASSTIAHQHSDPLVSLPQNRWLMLLRRFWSSWRF